MEIRKSGPVWVVLGILSFSTAALVVAQSNAAQSNATQGNVSQNNVAPVQAAQPASAISFPGEKHLRNLRQLTSGGQNPEAYFSADDKQRIFQHQGGNVPCDQIYTIPVDP